MALANLNAQKTTCNHARVGVVAIGSIWNVCMCVCVCVSLVDVQKW